MRAFNEVPWQQKTASKTYLLYHVKAVMGPTSLLTDTGWETRQTPWHRNPHNRLP
jgi:hypothetical protein